MSKPTKHTNIWIFLSELVIATVIPFIICWLNTPTNIINSNPLFGLIENIGFIGCVLMIFVGIPLGIIGIILSRKTKELRIATMVLSILNLSVGAIEVVVLALIAFTGLVLGVSV